ncbi:MAG: hypothetical protein J7K84_07880 [Deltaproteobacteria bacterium]|nr:hypothetical protein [Deltaproteobacteria bacterium]
MYQTLTNAPFEKSLLLVKVTDPSLALRFRHIGVFEGMELIRIKEDVKLQPIRVGGSKGDAVIGGGMSSKIIVRLDDGRKSSLAEMEPDETGKNFLVKSILGGRNAREMLRSRGIET